MIVVIEGGDQAGKKTQTELLSKALKKRKIKTLASTVCCRFGVWF